MELLLYTAGFIVLLFIVGSSSTQTITPPTVIIAPRPQTGCLPMAAFILGAGFMFALFVLATLG
jgi:hypothetical protein